MMTGLTHGMYQALVFLQHLPALEISVYPCIACKLLLQSDVLLAQGHWHLQLLAA